MKTVFRGNSTHITIIIYLFFFLPYFKIYFYFSWKELFPHILKIVSEIKLIRTEEFEMSGGDYKEMIITDICRFKVQPNISVALALMFRYFSLWLHFTHKYIISIEIFSITL